MNIASTAQAFLANPLQISNRATKKCRLLRASITTAVTLAAAILCTPRDVTAQSLRYSVTILPSPSSDPDGTYTTGINKTGQIVGWSPLSASAGYQAIVWTGTVPKVLSSVGISNDNIAYAINDAGQVVGTSDIYSVEWTGTTPQVLSLPAGFTYNSRPTAINDSGVVVGWAENANNEFQAVEWLNAAPSTFGSSGTQGGVGSDANSINNSGQIVGQAYSADEPCEWSGGTQIALGLLGPGDYNAGAINNNGQIVGWYYNTLNGEQHAIEWTATNTVILDNFSYPYSCSANAINDSGQAVGNYQYYANQVGLLFIDGTTYDLNTLIPPGSDVTITNATGINNLGQIAANGDYNGISVALRLDPVSNPYLTTVNFKTLGNPSDNSGGTQGGDPINLATGNVYRKITDYESAGQNKLSFDRYYNSMQSSVNSNTYAVSLGTNWRSTFDRYLSVNVFGATVLAERPDGQVLTFTSTSSGIWSADTDVATVLAQSGSNWTLTTPDDTMETYAPTSSGSEALLSTITARDGYVQVLSYNASNQLTSVVDTNNRSLQFAYYANGLLSSVTLPDQTVLIYGYSSSGVNGTNQDQLASVTYPTAPVTSWNYSYGNSSYPFALTSEIDELQHLFTTWTYDGQGHGASVMQSGSANYTQMVYESGSTIVTEPLGEQETYQFTTLQNVPKVTQINRSANGTVAAADEVITYDSNGYVASVQDWNQNITTYTHDNRGDELSRTMAAGTSLAETINTQWHPVFHLPTQIATPIETITLNYDGDGNMLSHTESGEGQSRTWNYSYNGDGEVLTGSDPDNNQTSYGYDGQGNLNSVTDALNHTTKILLTNSNGWPLTIQDPNGLVTTLTYDVRGNLTSRVALSETTSYTYDAANNLTQVTLPDNSYIIYSYDYAHRLIGVTDALGNNIVYTLDNMGNRIGTDIYDPNNNLVQTSSQYFDAISRLSQSVGAIAAETTNYGYDSNSNLTSGTDPLGNTTSNLYDALNRLYQTTDAKKGITKYGYDSNNRLTGVADPRNLATSYGLDGLGNLSTLTSPDTGVTSKTFDAAGNVKTSTDARHVTLTYGYDAFNRLTSVTSSSNGQLIYNYDEGTNGIGHLTSMIDLSGSTAWQYNQQGRVTQKAQTTGGITLTTKTSYDTAGRIETITYPSGHVLTYLYNPTSGLLSGIEVDGNTLISNVAYQPFGPVASWEQGNGGSYARMFDQDGRVTGIASTGGKKGDSITFGYDYNSGIESATDTLTKSKSFGYDALNRLAHYATGNASQTYSYDADGNRQSLKTSSVTSYDYATASNELTKAGTQKEGYDAAGNETASGSHGFEYNEFGQLAQAKSGKTITAEYAYNGLGQRVEKAGHSVTGKEVIFAYTDDGKLLGEYGPTGAPIEETVWLGDLPVGVIKGGDFYYINADQLGAPHTITDAHQDIVWEWTSDPFGNGLPNQKPSAKAPAFAYNLRFPGQCYDAETGLNYNMARYYNPAIGRYIQSDPIGLFGGLDTYAYVKNDPVTHIDFLGLWDIFVFLSYTRPLVSGPVEPIVESVGLLGYNSDTGFYVGTIVAPGLEAGGTQNNVSTLKGFERTTDCPQGKAITLTELTVGRAIRRLIGAGGGVGRYETVDEDGLYFYGDASWLGRRSSGGFGFSTQSNQTGPTP